MIYLASPYTHADADVRQLRFEQACKAAGELMSRGKVVFCPIAHTHPIALHHELPGEWEFWSRQDFGILRYAEALYVLTLDGWRDSKGIAAELGFAEALGIPTRLVSPDRVWTYA